VVDLTGGPDLAEDSVTGVFSVSKGISALVIATLVRDGQLVLDERVAHYWPEFGACGKDTITVRQLLSHQAGLVGVPGGLAFEELRDSSIAAARLAAACPDWRPGSDFGYHGITIGVFMEELTRRITGRTLQETYESEIRTPHDIDFYLGLPAAAEPRFREVLPMAPNSEQQAELDRHASAPDGLTALAFNSPLRGDSVVDSPISPNRRESRAAAAGRPRRDRAIRPAAGPGPGPGAQQDHVLRHRLHEAAPGGRVRQLPRVRSRRRRRRARLRRSGVRHRLRLHPDADPVPRRGRPEGRAPVPDRPLLHQAPQLALHSLPLLFRLFRIPGGGRLGRGNDDREREGIRRDEVAGLDFGPVR
jgi:CubicO group peptidase (beta-lactamase class C family)